MATKEKKEREGRSEGEDRGGEGREGRIIWEMGR